MDMNQLHRLMLEAAMANPNMVVTNTWPSKPGHIPYTETWVVPPPKIEKFAGTVDLTAQFEFRCSWHIAALGAVPIGSAMHMMFHRGDDASEKAEDAMDAHTCGLKSLEVIVNNPLDVPAKVTIAPALWTRQIGGEPKNDVTIMTPTYVLWQLGQAYKAIFEQEYADGRWKIWGHELNDLYFERLYVRGNRAWLSIGS